MTRPVIELASDVHHQVAQHIHTCMCFSLPMHESTDIYDTAQLAVFIRSVTDYFQLLELLGLESIHKTTKRNDLFATLKLRVERNNTDWTELGSICTDCAPALMGKKFGCMACWNSFLVNAYLNTTVFVTKKLCMERW